MTCIHLRKLYQLCRENDVKLVVSGSDLVRFVCHQCGEQEVCPSMLTDEYDARREDQDGPGQLPGDATDRAS
jgi:hypothetical protein